MRSRRRKLALSAITFLLGALVAYGGSVVWRAHALYAGLKAGGRGWRGHVLEADPRLGLRNAPGGRGAETYAIGPDVPSRIDADGYRVPLDAPDPRPRRRPLVLALGCSFTYGSSVLAEETFAWRVAEALEGTCLDAGLCGGGAAQMLLEARERIPRERPDWVLVQHSPWLLDRSRTPCAPTWAGRVPTPHFVRAGDEVRLDPPAFRPIVFDLPLAGFRDTPAGTADFARFLARVGAPLLVHDDALGGWEDLRRALGLARALASSAEVEAAVYPELARLCRASGARMVVVWLEARPADRGWEPSAALAELGVPIAAGTRRLVEELPVATRAAYVQAYTLVRGDPPRSLDAHPNARAHALIADEILRTIGRAHR